ncbi:hypothetical protein [Ligilactobacillus salivarius]|uniref:hypothetical protein n=1 Tax=Ligilactobacillus salivarius TaxID=1624 RepID=UPI00147590FA|nr:hypothetical protein [Ligilactobacillus salivarius]
MASLEGQNFIRFFIGIFGKILDGSCAKFQPYFEKNEQKNIRRGSKILWRK